MEIKNYIENGVVYNLSNIYEYLDKDYWDADDLKFDFWYRLRRHQQIFYKVMEMNNIQLGHNTDNYKDNTQKLLDEMTERNKNYNVKIIWDDDNDDDDE